MEGLEHFQKSSKVMNLEVERLTPCHLTVRVDVGNFESLAESFKICGVLEPLLVRPSKADPGKFEVICGMRRFLAAQKAGLKTVPCVVLEMDDCEAMEAMFIENIQREDLSDYEVGRWLKLLMEKFPEKYPSQQVAAHKFGISVQHANELIKHYEFLESVRSRLPPNISARADTLPEAMIREVRRAPEELQPKILVAVVRTMEKFERGEYPYPPSVRDVAELVDSYIRGWKREIETQEEKQKERIELPISTLEMASEPVKPIIAHGLTEEPIKNRLEAKEPEIPSEEKVERELEEVVKRRRETQKRREEAVVIALYKYYPENFMRDIESFCGHDASLEKLQKLAYYAVEVVWDRLSPEDKMDVLREAGSWMH